jgi:type VI secretion system secreted protein VgrG
MTAKSLLIGGAAVALSLVGVIQAPERAAASPFLGTAESFAVLGASTVSNTTATTINGDVGVVNPGTISGTGTITLIAPSTYQIDTAAAGLAQADASTAFGILAALPFTTNLTGQDLGSVGVLTPGVYFFSSSAQLTGTLTLNFAGASNEEFVFQIGSTLTTASASDVIVENGNSTDSVYFEVGSSATLGTNTVFAGNILAEDSITLDTSAEILCGRAIALTAAITMEDNTISNDCTAYNAGSGRSDFGSTGFSGVSSTTTTPVPEPSTLMGFGTALFALIGIGWRRSRLV